MPRSKKGARSRKKKQSEKAASKAPDVSELPTAPALSGPSDNLKEDAVSTVARPEPTSEQLARRLRELELLTAQEALATMLVEEQRSLVIQPSAPPPVEKTDVCAIYTPFTTSSAILALTCCSF